MGAIEGHHLQANETFWRSGSLGFEPLCQVSEAFAVALVIRAHTSAYRVSDFHQTHYEVFLTPTKMTIAMLVGIIISARSRELSSGGFPGVIVAAVNPAKKSMMIILTAAVLNGNLSGHKIMEPMAANMDTKTATHVMRITGICL